MVTKTKVAATQLAFESSIKIDVRNIKPNPYQPLSRIVPPADVLAETMRSIKQSGLLQIPLARQEPGSAPGLFWEMGDGWIRRCSFERLAIDRLCSKSLIPKPVLEVPFAYYGRASQKGVYSYPNARVGGQQNAGILEVCQTRHAND